MSELRRLSRRTESEVAKQIFIFPAELSGAAEGSVLTDPPGATTHSRMTNGSVSSPSVSHSRMTNGTVQKGSGTTLVVRYQDGSQTISVPPDVPVTEVAPEQVTFGAGRCRLRGDPEAPGRNDS